MDVIITAGPYGFGKTWTLVCYGRRFFLGQDAKVCSRGLGLTPREVVMEIGTNRLDTEAGRKKLAKFLVKSFGITRSNVAKLESWSLACE